MKTWMIVLCALAVGPAGAQSVYKCKTAQGVVYSQSPCGDDAEKRTVAVPSAPGSSDAASGPVGPFVELTRDERFMVGGSAEKIRQVWGPPAARYRKGNEERWFYPNRGVVENGVRQCIELHVDGDTAYQITYLSEAAMTKSVPIARRIGDWRPPSPMPTRRFYAVGGGDPRGMSKSAVVARFGEPDLKKIFNGIEVWEYHDIPMSQDNPQTLTLFIEFDGDRVSQTIGN